MMARLPVRRWRAFFRFGAATLTNAARRTTAPGDIGESPVSRASLIDVYISSLPFTAVAIVAIPGGGCRIEVGGTSAPTFYFKQSHLDLLLGAAGLGDGPIDAAPDAVAARLEKAARAMHAPYETAAEIRAAAEKQVAAIIARVDATNQAGGLRELNRQYKAYRQGQIAKAERAVQYRTFLEQRYTVGIVRSVASVGRMI